MKIIPKRKTCGILNKGDNAWLFAEFALELARNLWLEVLEEIPNEVLNIATKTLQTTHLFNSFGCVDLIEDENKNWLVLEVGTDGIFNYVDRNIGNEDLEREINQRLAEAFWSSFSEKPWVKDSWHPRM